MTETFPDWAGFTPAFAASELERLLVEAEAAVAALEASEPRTYEDFVWRLDDAARDLLQCWGGVSHMTSVVNSDAWRKVEEAWQPKVVKFSLRVNQSRRLYALARERLQAADAEKGPSAEARRRILARIVQAAELSGVGLTGEAKERFNAIQMQLAKLGMDFHNAVLDATKAFSFAKDGKTYTIDDANYPETMKHCADREIREKLYFGRATRAPENEARIVETLKLRDEEAKILGFKNFAEKSLATKCAPSVGAVLKMIDDLDVATAEIAAAEGAELEASADLPNLEPWDIAFYSERLRERTYAYSEEELKRHFELEDVLKGLFRITEFLFGVTVEEVTGTRKPSVWHLDVRFFAVREKGVEIAHFYFDPFVRNGFKSGGAWMNEFRNRKVRGVGEGVGEGEGEGEGEGRVTLPLAVIVTNFPERDGEGRCLLPFREVETLFHEFGHALQQMLTRVDEEGAAGINLVEWDAVEVASQFMENWCLDDRTGIAVPEALKAKVRAAKNFRAAFACRRQLSFAKVDMALHVGPPTDAPLEVQREVFAHFGMPRVAGDLFLCTFSHIFAGGYAAGYYGYKWAEVMSADCYGAFEEAGLADDEALRRLGEKYRETVLALGGSRSALEVFRAFRGRDPEIGALLRQQDLVK